MPGRGRSRAHNDMPSLQNVECGFWTSMHVPPMCRHKTGWKKSHNKINHLVAILRELQMATCLIATSANRTKPWEAVDVLIVTSFAINKTYKVTEMSLHRAQNESGQANTSKLQGFREAHL